MYWQGRSKLLPENPVTLDNTSWGQWKLHATSCSEYTVRLVHILLYDTTLQYNTLQYTTLHYTTLHYAKIHYTTLQYTTIRYTTLQYTALQYIALHRASCESPPDNRTQGK